MRFNIKKANSLFLIFSWALYDLANQFFALNIVTLYFVRWLTLEKQAPEIFYSLSFGISTFFVATLGTILGIASDMTGRRKPPLVFLTALAVIFTVALGFRDSLIVNLIFFAIANFGCQAAIVFYNALMVNIAPPNRIGLISGIGRAFGYAGAILALYLIKPIVLRDGYRATFIPSGILFLIFSLPCLLFVRDKIKKDKVNFSSLFKADKFRRTLEEFKETACQTYKIGGVSDFLKASFFGLAAVNAIILFMAVYATKIFALGEKEIIHLVAFSTIFAILGSLLSGFLSDYLGNIRSLAAVFILWIISFFIGATARSAQLYWVIGALVGLTLGATWVVSRSLVISLVPKEKMGTVFGMFNLVAYLAAIIGALFWGVMLLFLGRFGEMGYRITLFSLNLFMAVGLIFVWRLLKMKREKR